jgi:hypothetical protein
MSANPLSFPALAPARPVGPFILPRVWATASLAQAVDGQQRKGPHGLVLLRAAAEAHPAAQDVALQTPKTQRNVEPGLAFYRKYTEGMLRRYAKMSMEQGRVPSLLGRELFRGNVTHCKVQGFDDAVIFVHDIHQCLETLDPGLRHLVRRISLEGYTQQETAALLGIGLRTVIRRYYEALDKLTRVLLERKLLQPLMAGLEESLSL